MRFHPEAFANFVAVIVATGDVDMLVAKGVISAAPAERLRTYQALVDFRRSQVLSGARAYYSQHPVDYDSSNDDWRKRAPMNGLQNLARLDRKNLLH